MTDPLAKCRDAAHFRAMPDRSRKRPSDPNKLAKSVVDQATKEKDPAAVSLGRKGGLKGGPARAAKLTAKEREEASRLAAQARWRKKD